MANTNSHTAPIHGCNQHLIPSLRFDGYRAEGTASDGEIANRHVKAVLAGTMSISQARNALWSYPAREAKLASFDRWLMDHLANCGPRRSPLVP